MKANKYAPKFWESRRTKAENSVKLLELELVRTRKSLASAIEANVTLKRREHLYNDRLFVAEMAARRYKLLRESENITVIVLDGEARNLKGEALDKYLDDLRFVRLFPTELIVPPALRTHVLQVLGKKDQENDDTGSQGKT